MFTHHAYGLKISSDIQLHLPEGGGAVDVFVTEGPAKAPSGADSDAVHVEVPGVLRATIANGTSIRYHRLADCSESELRRSIVGAAMGVILQQRGLLVMHAGAVAIGDVAIAFAGPSGAGKSTLTDAFERAGHACFADDLALIDTTGTVPMVEPGLLAVRLRTDSAEHAGWSTADRTRTGGDVKASRSLTPADAPKRLAALYFLGWGDELSISRLRPAAALPRLVAATRANALLEDPAVAARHLRQCGSVLANSTCADLRRRRHFDDLGAVVKALVRDASAV